MTSSYQRPVTFKNIMRFAIPTIIMSVFTSLYTMIDGLFVSNLIGTQALSSINLVAPILSLITAISAMLATGGSAVIMRKMGEQKASEAKQDFTMLILTNVVIGVVMMILGYLFMDTIFTSMNISPNVLNYCKTYLSHYLLFTIPVLLMYNFSLYMIAADKSKLSLICSIAGGVTNIVLDYLLIAVLDMGIGGAAIATGTGYSITAIAGLIIFSNKKNLLHFVKPVFRWRTLVKTSTNGISEMATSLVTGVVTLMFNAAMLKYVGEDGVAAITIIMYVLMFACSFYTGYAYGVAPMISYYYGEDNHDKLRRLIKLSFTFIGSVSILSAIGSFIATPQMVSIFTRPDNPVYDIAITGNKICSLALLFVGFNIFASGMFTALSNGIVSAALALSRSFVFMVIAISILPLVFGITGLWFATPFAECLGLLMAAFFFKRYQKQYRY
ncbi:MATE family efflux transporter [Niameybacter massiliensis]|uniref:MATE family efflux transporter n=1 Tax=Niameybacter massiliensis TaxID=1658108 RepID=UPI0006B43AE6|nr:MATE family efflux transporter [Niameybacter massiliensis]